MSCTRLASTPDVSHFRREPAEVMRLARLGAAHPMRLSFLRVLLRRMKAEGWRFDCPLFELDARSVGRAVYRVTGPERAYSLVCFSHDLPPEQRSDRVIAQAWDATFTLFDGTPEAADLDRLQANVPRQEAGRISPRELTLSRANRSVRLFEHVVESLARGQQPDAAEIAQTGYLMRTTAVYGSGKFGAADRVSIANRPELTAPFQAEMLSVWLIRRFSVDLVEHLARARGGAQAVALAPVLRRALGVGNSTGLGMAPFLVRHPVLLNNWLMVREEALARVRTQEHATPRAIAGFTAALSAARENAGHWQSAHPLQLAKLADLRAGLAALESRLAVPATWAVLRPWDALWRWGEEALAPEAQEALLALMLEPHGALVDGLVGCMADDGAMPSVDGAMSVGVLRALIGRNYGWALGPDYEARSAQARFWYVSEDKLEPRLGERFEEPGAERELPLDIGRQVATLAAALEETEEAAPVAAFLLAHPGHRPAIRRVQLSAGRPFAEIRDNLISAEMLPIDMLRLKLAFFGASRFDPRSDRWVRISLFQGAPHPEDLAAEPAA